MVVIKNKYDEENKNFAQWYMNAAKNYFSKRP